MGADTVIQKIEEKAGAEVAQLLHNAEAVAQELHATVLQEAQARAKQLTTQANAQAQLLLRAGAQQAASENKIALLNHRHALLREIKKETKAKLMALSDGAFCALIEKLVAENAAGGVFTLRVPEKDVAKYTDTAFYRAACDKSGTLLEAMEAAANAKFTLSEEAAPIDGGLWLCAETYDLDISYDALLDTLFAQHEKVLADCLFCGEEGTQ